MLLNCWSNLEVKLGKNSVYQSPERLPLGSEGSRLAESLRSGKHNVLRYALGGPGQPR